MKYTDRRWAAERLLHTYIVYQNEVVLVDERDGDRFLLRGKNNIYYDTIENLDLAPPRATNFNSDLTSAHFSRKAPRRDYRQGFRRSSVDCYWYRALHPCEFHAYDLNPALKGEFPSLRKAIEKVQDKFTSVALSNSFSIDEDGLLVYKSKVPVGKINQNENGFLLDPDFNYLTQRYEHELGVNKNDN